MASRFVIYHWSFLICYCNRGLAASGAERLGFASKVRFNTFRVIRVFRVIRGSFFLQPEKRIRSTFEAQPFRIECGKPRLVARPFPTSKSRVFDSFSSDLRLSAYICG